MFSISPTEECCDFDPAKEDGGSEFDYDEDLSSTVHMVRNVAGYLDNEDDEDEDEDDDDDILEHPHHAHHNHNIGCCHGSGGGHSA